MDDHGWVDPRSMDPLTVPGAAPAERRLATVRRVVVPVAAELLVLLAVTAGEAAADEVAARYGATRVSATVVGTRPDAGPVTVAWSDPRQGARVADVTSGGRTTAGATTTVWLGADGEPTAPRAPTETRTAAVLRTVTVLVVGAVLLWGVDRWARSRTGVLASARIDREWRAVERRWRAHPAD